MLPRFPGAAVLLLAFSASDHDNRNTGASGIKLGLHQFYQSATLDEPTKKAFSAVDKSSYQMIMAILLEYTPCMGADVRLVQAATPPYRHGRTYTGLPRKR
jgi:hypothetical protein